MLPSSAPPPGWAGEFSCPYMVKQGPQIIVLCVQRAHPRDRYLTELTLAGRGAHATTVIVWGHVLYFCLMVLLLSKPTFLSNR